MKLLFFIPLFLSSKNGNKLALKNSQLLKEKYVYFLGIIIVSFILIKKIIPITTTIHPQENPQKIPKHHPHHTRDNLIVKLNISKFFLWFFPVSCVNLFWAFHCVFSASLSGLFLFLSSFLFLGVGFYPSCR